MGDTPADNTNKETPESGASLEDRIAAVVGQRNTAQEANAALVQQNQLLQNQLSQVTEQVKTFTQGTRPPANDPLERLMLEASGGVPTRETKRSPGSDGVSPQDILAAVQQALDQKLAPITERIESSQKLAERNRAQQVSFNVASQQYPDLLDPQSELSRITDTLFQQLPEVAELDNAPVLFATMAKGIVGDTKKVQKGQDARKAQAAINRPGGTVDLLSVDRDRVEGAKELTQQIVDKTHAQGSEVLDFAQMFQAKLTELSGAGD